LRMWSPRKYYKHQADATLSQANPVSTTLYTILAATANARIIGISVVCTWTVQPTMDLVITIDGQTLTYSIAAPVSTTMYYPATESNRAPDAQQLSTTEYSVYRAFFLEGKSIMVQARTNGGTVSNLSGRVKYAKLV